MKFNLLKLQGQLNSEITNLVILSDVDSTNTFIKTIDSKKMLDLVVTEKQSAGRGRRGNAWDSPEIGNIYMSLKFAVSDTIPALSLVTGLVVKKAIQEVSKDINVLLKWPNDLILNQRKAGGILVEIDQDKKIGNFIVGIGINIESDVANKSWIGLKEIDNEVDRNKIIINIVSAFEKIASGKEKFKNWQSEWEKHCVHMHKEITLNLNDSDKVVGIFEGINHKGEMLLSNENGILTFNSGECSVDYASI
jgi:BirA family biotin operon repressor/biotin-[acetyl-CoA-carboxylase] ligase